MDDLIQKLMVSKKIMDKHNEMPRHNSGDGMMANINVQEFSVPQAQYSLPEEFIQEQKPVQQPQVASRDRILNSKLPDEIKQLMIENPIVPPSMGGSTVLSDELVDKASRLMRTNASGQIIKEAPQRQPQGQNVSENTNLKQMVKDAVREILSENGMIVESTQKSNDTFTFRVGSHIFEGKVSKIKKIK